MLALPTASCHPGSSVKRPWGRVRRLLPLGNFFFAITWISLIVSIVFFIVAWVTVVPDALFVNNRVPLNTTGLSIRGHCVQLDLDARKLSILWAVVACDFRPPSTGPPARAPENCGPSDRALDVYINDPSTPAFSYKPYEPIGKALDIRNQLTFTMEHHIDRYGKWNPAEQLTVLFERYVFHAFAFAIDPTTNHSVHVAMFSVADTVGDFVVRSDDTTATNQFIYDSGDGQETAEAESRVLQAEIRRSAIAKAFVICLSFVNWSLAVGSVYITILVTLGRLETNSMVAALPFSALLTIPAVHSLYSTSPVLGISIDAAAFFVQIVIVALCSFVLLKIFTGHRLPSPPTGYPV